MLILLANYMHSYGSVLQHNITTVVDYHLSIGTEAVEKFCCCPLLCLVWIVLFPPNNHICYKPIINYYD